jgi:alpha-L-arabinofuranosidase
MSKIWTLLTRPMKHVALALALASTHAHAETRLRLHDDQPGPTISKDVYGQFAEHLGRGIYGGVWVGPRSTIANTRGLRNDVLFALRDLQVPVVRWPGGCFADLYHWRDGVGSALQRQRTTNSSWGGVVEDNSFGTHEFFDLVELLGADAYLNINVGTGSPQEMLDWLEYITSESDSSLTNWRRRNGRGAPWRLRYLGIGNEAWGCGGSMSPEHYSDLYRHYATFLRAPEGKRPIVIASGGQNDETQWTQVLLDRVKPSWTLRMEGISHHYYTIPTGTWAHKGLALGFGEDEWFSTLSRALHIREILQNNVRILDKKDPGKKVSFVVDEWGTWYDPADGGTEANLYQQNTLRDALLAALHFHVFHAFAERVTLTSIAQMVNVLQAMILTEGDKMLLTPTYHAFHMYRPFQGARRVALDLQSAPEYEFRGNSIPKLSATAARGKDGKLYVGLVNTHPTAAERVHLEGHSGFKAARGRLLTASQLDAHNTFAQPSAVKPVSVDYAVTGGRVDVELPAKSVLVLSLD